MKSSGSLYSSTYRCLLVKRFDFYSVSDSHQPGTVLMISRYFRQKIGGKNGIFDSKQSLIKQKN
jgi:hypothetical protein